MTPPPPPNGGGDNSMIIQFLNLDMDRMMSLAVALP